MSEFHQPVLLNEVAKYLAVKKNGKYIDATVGGGGHAKAVCQLGGQLLGIDCDPEAINSAREYLSSFAPQSGASEGLKTTACPTSWRLVSGNFKDLKQIALANNFAKVDGVLFDLGVSSYQLTNPKRGFSFNSEALLDMRMDPKITVTAADLVNGLNKGELEELFVKLGQEHFARRIAQAVVEARRLKPIRTCNELAEIIMSVRRKRGRFDRTHPATRVFQALRIAVNDELNNLRQALPQALEILNDKGRLVVISFHSGEDRLVKYFLKEMEAQSKLYILTKKPIRPSEQEVKENPRSRSAKLRAAEKR